MQDTPLFQNIEQTLTLDYKENPSRYDEVVTSLSNRISRGHDDRGTAFTQEELQSYADFKARLLAKKAEDTRPRIGGSRFI